MKPGASGEATTLARDAQWQFVRFVVVGVANTAFSYGIYVLFVHLGFNYAVANLISLVLGMLVSFITQGRLVFKHTNNRRLARFVLVWAVIYGLNVLVIGMLISMGFNAYASGAIALPVNVAISFVAQKYFVFRRSPEDAV